MSNLSPHQFDYQMHHRPAGPGEDSGAPFHRAEDVMPDVTGPKGAHLYDNHAFAPGRRIPHALSISAESFRQVRQAKNNPEAKVNIYRAVPKAEHGINSGDWVTTSRKYAEKHASNEATDKPWSVVAGTARADEIHGHGDDVNEWGYHPR